MNRYIGCTCHLGHPPCSFCVEYVECNICGDAFHNPDGDEFSCEYCRENKTEHRGTPWSLGEGKEEDQCSSCGSPLRYLLVTKYCPNCE